MSLRNHIRLASSLLATVFALSACDDVEVPPGPPPAGSGGEPSCLSSPSQVVALGDSYVSLPVMLVPKVEDLARADGALGLGQRYRDFSFPGTTLGSPAAPGSIPPQWDSAVRGNPNITTVIMDGGGNDLILGVDSLLNDCLGVGARRKPACTAIVQGAMNMVRQMAQKMKAQGVQDVVYFLYPHVPLGGDDILDYSVEQAQALATELSTDSFRFHLVDTRGTFQGHPEYFGGLDPIHANEAGGRQIARLVWETMKRECIAQPASSGCCKP